MRHTLAALALVLFATAACDSGTAPSDMSPTVVSVSVTVAPFVLIAATTTGHDGNAFRRHDFDTGHRTLD